jgi:hypothetical protein
MAIVSRIVVLSIAFDTLQCGSKNVNTMRGACSVHRSGSLRRDSGVRYYATSARPLEAVSTHGFEKVMQLSGVVPCLPLAERRFWRAKDEDFPASLPVRGEGPPCREGALGAGAGT